MFRKPPVKRPLLLNPAVQEISDEAASSITAGWCVATVSTLTDVDPWNFNTNTSSRPKVIYNFYDATQF